jgi:HlyD family secretion protein
MQSVTIRTGDTNVSPEEVEKRKQKQTQKDKSEGSSAEVTNERQEKQTQKEERENLQKGVFKKVGNKAVWTKVTTGIADDASMEIKSGVNAGDEIIAGSYSAISRKLKDGAKVVIDKEATK